MSSRLNRVIMTRYFNLGNGTFFWPSHNAQKKKHKLNLTSFDHMMIFVALLSPASMIPQIVKIFMMEDAGSISLLTFALKLFIVLPWLAYGILHRSKPIICSNALWFVVSAIIVTQVIVY